MADHILDGFSASDTRYGARRDVAFDANDEVLTVTVRDINGDYEERHFRLTEVVQRWIEVEA